MVTLVSVFVVFWIILVSYYLTQKQMLLPVVICTFFIGAMQYRYFGSLVIILIVIPFALFGIIWEFQRLLIDLENQARQEGGEE